MPRGVVVGQGPDVEDRVIAAERELEAVLPLGRAVAGPRVAAQPREHRRDVVHEVDLRTGVCTPEHGHRHLGRLARQAEDQRRLAVGLGPHQPRPRDLGDLAPRAIGSTIRVASIVSPEASLPVTRSWT